MKDGYLELEKNLKHKAPASNLYADVEKRRLVTSSPIALFTKLKLTSSSGKEIENSEKAHIACLIYKIIKNSKDSDDSSIGFR